MATYNLQQDEKEVKTSTISWLSLLGPIILCFLVIGIPMLIYRVLRRATTAFVITNKRVIWSYGILSKSSKEAPLDAINNVSHTQSLWGRVFNCGNVQLQTASEMGSTVFEFIDGPVQFKNEIMNQKALHKKAEIQEQAQALADGIRGSAPAAVATGPMKVCPECAEDIKAAAKVCRFCKHEF